VHKPVLLDEMLLYRNPRADGKYIDATFGGGGYSRAILASQGCKMGCKVVGIDRDPDARERSLPLSQEYGDSFTFLRGCFGDIDEIITDHFTKDSSTQEINGIVFDFGVSSFQLDDAERGFSFRFDGPLDMRMSASGESAFDVVNKYKEDQIAHILWCYGEEPKSRRIAASIVAERKKQPITTTLQLAEIVRKIVKRKDGIDPATLTFQGLRIFVNNELTQIDSALKKSIALLKVGGVIVTVAFHGLEDRIVKDWYRASKADPFLKGKNLKLESLTKKAVTPSQAELRENPRSRSAKLRAFRVVECDR